jgi:hypothetical protein
VTVCPTVHRGEPLHLLQDRTRRTRLVLYRLLGK